MIASYFIYIDLPLSLESIKAMANIGQQGMVNVAVLLRSSCTT